MPKLNNTAELQAEALKRKQERDKIAQANWVAKNKEVHLERMREQYQKKKAKLLAEKVARGEVPVVKPVPVVAVQPPNQLKNGTIDNSTLADAIKKIKDDYARVRVFKVYGASPSQAQQEGFMRDLTYPADLVIKNKSKLTPAHLSAITELGKDLTSILHHDFVVKKTRKLRVKVDTSEREARERAMMEAEDRNAYVPEPKKRKLKKMVEPENNVINNTRPDGVEDDRGAVYTASDFLWKTYVKQWNAIIGNPKYFIGQAVPQYIREANPQWRVPLKDLKHPPADFFVKELDNNLSPRQIFEMSTSVYDNYAKRYIEGETGKYGQDFWKVFKSLLEHYRTAKGLGKIQYK